MKKFFIILLAISLFFITCTAVAEEDSTGNQKQTPGTEKKKAEPGADENGEKSSSPVPRLDVNWQEMNDMQLALAIINRQIEYLMAQVEKNNREITGIIEKNNENIAAIEEEHVKEMEKIKAEKEEEIEKLNKELAEKDRQLADARKEINKLSGRAALFSAENDMVPRLILIFSVGLIAGMVFNSLLLMLRKKNNS